MCYLCPMAKNEQVARGKGQEDQPRRIVVYLAPKIAKRLRVRCAESDRTISSAAGEAIERWLDT